MIYISIKNHCINYRENAVAVVFTDVLALINLHSAVTCSQFITYDVYIHNIWKGGNSFNHNDICMQQIQT